MLYSSIISTVDNKFKGVVINNTTSNIIYETPLYEIKGDALRAVNNFIINNSKQIAQDNNKTLSNTVTKQPTKTVVVKKCCGRR
jgi:hypothetical protein